MTDYKTLLVETLGQIEVLTFNRPDERNSITPQMAKELGDYFELLQERSSPRVVVMRSTGKTFCAGAALDSDAFARSGSGRPQRQMVMQRLYSRIPALMRRCPQPIIALVQGAACGAGFSIALAADVRFGEPSTRMNAAYLRVGVGGCDMGSGYLLPRLVGLSIASELLLTGKFIGAARALAVGLVSDIVPGEVLLETGLALANEMLLASPMGLRMTKETLNMTAGLSSIDAALTLEDRQQVILLETDDHREAVAAFRERRPPSYQDL